MKKTLLATAIAGALGASAAAQAATVYNQDGTQLDIYGNLQISYKNVKNDIGNWEDELFDNGSTIGFSGQHIINPGLTGYFKAEFEFDADEQKGTGKGINRGDQAYMGLKGNFGDVRLGSWDPLIDDWTQDPIGNNEYFDPSDSTTDIGGLYGYSLDDSDEDIATDREGDKLQYMSPVWAGLQFAIGTQYVGDAESEFNANHHLEGEGVSSNGSNASFFGGLKYAYKNFSVAAVYDDLDNYDLHIGGEEYSAKAYSLLGQYTIDTLRVALKVEDTDATYAGDDGDIMRYALGARYGYALSDNFSGDVYGSYQYVDADKEVAALANPGGYSSASDAYVGDDTFNEFIIGATYNISPAMYTYIEYAQYDRSHDAGDGVAVGALYAF